MCGLAGLAAEREHEGVVVERDGPALQRRVVDEDELAGPELVLVAVDGEPGSAAQDEVDLLVAEAALGVLLDDLPPASRRVYALTPKARMPKWRRIGRQTKPSGISIASSSSTCVTAHAHASSSA